MNKTKKLVAAAVLMLSLSLGFTYANTQNHTSLSAAIQAIASEINGSVTINTFPPPDTSDPAPTPTPVGG